jgi:hypothetical protein
MVVFILDCIFSKPKVAELMLPKNAITGEHLTSPTKADISGLLNTSLIRDADDPN